MAPRESELEVYVMPANILWQICANLNISYNAWPVFRREFINCITTNQPRTGQYKRDIIATTIDGNNYRFLQGKHSICIRGAMLYKS